MSSVGDKRVLKRFHPVVQGWFEDRFDAPSQAQAEGWPHIQEDKDVLIAAPTGSGKTLAAFLACIDKLIRQGQLGALEDETEVLYISPLKALSNDIKRNLEEPLQELIERAASEGTLLPPIRTALRTGDTPASERAKINKKPPHILITTPESFYLMLTAEKSRKVLSSVRTVIVDEIHAMAGDKRGSHLALSMARLDRLVRSTGRSAPNRVGLSATQRPIEDIAQLLVGADRKPPAILDGGHSRTLDVAIETTNDELSAVASNEQFGRVYDRIAELVSEHETTLVFVNTRRLVERLSRALEERLGEEQVVAHHGSLSRKLRFSAEQKLKSGEVRCAVATASLELGIDVGSVDLVVQLGSPRSIATLLQRIGRSGHSLGKTPKGRLFALTRDQLGECAALVRAIKNGNLDAIEIPENSLDVLSQQIVAEVASSGETDEDELFEHLRSAYPYRGLQREDYDAVLEILCEGISTQRGRSRAHLHRDRIHKRLKPRKGARLAAITCGGAIPDTFNYPVVTYPDETPVGSLDEDFAIESNAGDIFLLGNTSWRIHRVEAGRVLVSDAAGAPPSIPFWLGEAPARTRELSEEIADLRADFETQLESGKGPDEMAGWLADECNMPEQCGAELYSYWFAGRNALGALPTKSTIIAERFFDEAGGMQLVIHSPLGGRINKAWGLALRKRFCRSFNQELQAAATDDGLLLSLGPPHSFELESVFDFLRSKTVRKVLGQAVLGSPVFGIRWRWAACRSLAVLRNNAGKRLPPQILRMRSDDMLSTVFPMQQACLENVVGDIEIPDHPLVKETVKDCLTEFMDIDGLEEVITAIESGEIRVLAKETREPSPLCHELINANPYAFLDDAPLEERRTRAVSLPRGLDLGSGDLSILDDAAIEQAEREAEPTVRDPDELHDALMSLYLMPVRQAYTKLASVLIASNRATLLRTSKGSEYWIAAERYPAISEVLPPHELVPALPPLPFEVESKSREDAALAVIRGHMDVLGPRSPGELSELCSLEVDDIRGALAKLEGDGSVLCGSYSSKAKKGEVKEWCNKRILARIQRLTIGRLRKAIEPVSAATLQRFLLSWQRVDKGSKLIGADGLLRIVEQLQGFESASGAWEHEILPRRLHGYDPSWLDALCMSGQVTWTRLTPKQAPAEGKGRGLQQPTKAAPLTLMRREDMRWLRACAPAFELDKLSSRARKVYEELRGRGAFFLSDMGELLGELGTMPATQLEEALWELALAGLAHADGFATLRLFINRHKGEKRSRFDAGRQSSRVASSRWRTAMSRSRKRDTQRRAHGHLSVAAAAGRWSMLREPDLDDADPMLHAQQLLQRYGVVFRDMLVRESALPPWRELLICLRRLEARGEIRGGRFVSGFVGEQFALPDAVSALRSMRGGATPPGSELVEVAATDPLNTVGILSPGPKVPAVLGNKVLYRDGVPLASLESGNVVLRQELREGELVDDKLRFHTTESLSPELHQEPLPFGPAPDAEPRPAE